MSASAPIPTASRVEAAGRGATRIADRVVARIASQAAREVLRALPEAHLVPRDRRGPQATVRIQRPSGTRPDRRARAMVRLSVDVGYPADLRAVCAELRRHVVARVGELADMEVPEVSVEIERLHSASMAPDHGKVT